MEFNRYFNTEKLKINFKQNKSIKNLYIKLMTDEDVFPAIRAGNIDFYYAGGVLFSFNGSSFSRNYMYNPKYIPKYNKEGKREKGHFVNEKVYYQKNPGSDNFLDDYETLKKENAVHFKKAKDESSTERDRLSYLYKNSLTTKSNIIVLDIEVRLNEGDNPFKKCDMVLLNKLERKIMFVEAKICTDPRMRNKDSKNKDLELRNNIEVVNQVNEYSKSIEDLNDKIVETYKKYIGIIKSLNFSSAHLNFFNDIDIADINNHLELIPKAKLLVYDYDETFKDKKEIIDSKLEVFWIDKKRDDPSLSEIWSNLCK